VLTGREAQVSFSSLSIDLHYTDKITRDPNTHNEYLRLKFELFTRNYSFKKTVISVLKIDHLTNHVYTYV
jgi:hypothetical protein